MNIFVCVLRFSLGEKLTVLAVGQEQEVLGTDWTGQEPKNPDAISSLSADR